MTAVSIPVQAGSKARPVWVVVLAAGIITGLAMGLRQVMGLYLKPLTTDLGIGREPFSNAMALANLTWGVTAIFAGGIADKYGAGRVIVTCAMSTILGLLAMRNAVTADWLYLSGLLTGIGIAGTSISAVSCPAPASPLSRRGCTMSKSR